MDCGLFGVRFLFLGMKKERCSMDELFIYFATPPFPPHMFIFKVSLFRLFQSLKDHLIPVISIGQRPVHTADGCGGGTRLF